MFSLEKIHQHSSKHFRPVFLFAWFFPSFLWVLDDQYSLLTCKNTSNSFNGLMEIGKTNFEKKKKIFCSRSCNTVRVAKRYDNFNRFLTIIFGVARMHSSNIFWNKIYQQFKVLRYDSFNSFGSTIYITRQLSCVVSVL